MRIELIVEATELEIKKAIAEGWNERYKENLTHKDIAVVGHREDIVAAIPFLDSDKIEITVE